MIELTKDQIRALGTQKDGPLQLVNPQTGEVYVLVSQKVYQLTSRIVSGPNHRGWDNPADDGLIGNPA